MKALSDRIHKLVYEFVQIERELTKKGVKLGTDGIFFDRGSFQMETPNDPDSGSIDVLTILEVVQDLIDDSAI